MDFQALRFYLEQWCDFDHFEEGAFFVCNRLTRECCIIEDQEEYSEVTLCHYFKELQVSPPSHMTEVFDRYLKMRDDIDHLHAKIEKQIEEQKVTTVKKNEGKKKT